MHSNGQQKAISVYKPIKDLLKILLAKLETSLLEAIQVTSYADGRDNSGEVILLIRRSEEQFYIKNTSCSKKIATWENPDFNLNKKFTSTDESEEQELNRSLSILKNDYLPPMLASLKEPTTVAAEVTVKFKRGSLYWIILRYEKDYSSK